MIKRIIDEQMAQVLAIKGIVPRTSLAELVSLLSLKHIITITGVRRCGKSVLLKELIHQLIKKRLAKPENILYLNLENPYFNQYKNDVRYLAEIYGEFKKTADKKKKIFVLLDEVQFFNDWQVFVKDLYEWGEVKVILTGSNSKLLSSDMATILSGRSINLQLFPYSYREFLLVNKTASTAQFLGRGGFPEIATIQEVEKIKLIIETYYKNTLYQDVIPRFNIKNTLEIENLSYYLISNTAKIVSYNRLKNISKLDDKTIKQYISYLEDANLVYEIYNYDPSLKKQIGNKKKIYAVDTAFMVFLGFSASPNYGRLLENAVYIELRRRKKDVYFYSNGNECDFVIKKGHRIVECIQVCASLDDENTREREILSLIATMETFGVLEGLIITEKESDEFTLDGKKIIVIPFKTWAMSKAWR